jgi:aerobic-type carbon monoxide dehydrogenase small subunit (CoxS/CutS family)
VSGPARAAVALGPDGLVPPDACVDIELAVNGRRRRLAVAPHHTLLEVLRDDLRLTGTKECCLVGECGACTIMLDGRSVDSCLVLAVEADGGEVLTVEGLASGSDLEGGSRLGGLQRAFLSTSAAQCGFCIPGQLMAAHALLARKPHPTRAEVEEGLAGNLCRCAGYEQIIEAVLRAAARGGKDEGPTNGQPAGSGSVPDPASTPDARLAPQ